MIMPPHEAGALARISLVPYTGTIEGWGVLLVVVSIFQPPTVVILLFGCLFLLHLPELEINLSTSR